MKRFIRDHVRYNDVIQCAAARVVYAIRQRARKRGDPNGDYDSFHVRRGDFSIQFKDAVVDAARLVERSKGELKMNATVYFATDERNRSYFDPLRERYDVVFLDDFQEALQGVDINYYGHIDQLVASRGRVFFGCWYSTFTGYINRLRGYHANKAKAPGYEDGVIASWYYAPFDHHDDMRKFYPVHQAFYNREFPASWRYIDRGIDEIAIESKA
jgi:hypothetical protein